MKQKFYIETIVEDKIISANVAVEEQLMMSLLLEILEILQKEFHLSYKAEGMDLTQFQEYFKNRHMVYNENDAQRFFVKKYPELMVENLNDRDLKFIADNWNGSSQRSDIIIATTDFQKNCLLDVKTFNPYDCLRNPNVFFVITDGDNPDEYSAFGIYMRHESFSLVSECIISGIQKLNSIST